LPWPVVREAINGALQTRYLETTLDSGPWRCKFIGAPMVKLQTPAGKPEVQPPPPPPLLATQLGVRVGAAELKLNEIQDLADVVGT